MSELYDCILVVHKETANAWCVSETGDADKTVWIPKSQAEIYEKIRDYKFWTIHEFTMPYWLAHEKKLI